MLIRFDRGHSRNAVTGEEKGRQENKEEKRVVEYGLTGTRVKISEKGNEEGREEEGSEKESSKANNGGEGFGGGEGLDRRPSSIRDTSGSRCACKMHHAYGNVPRRHADTVV